MPGMGIALYTVRRSKMTNLKKLNEHDVTIAPNVKGVGFVLHYVEDYEHDVDGVVKTCPAVKLEMLGHDGELTDIYAAAWFDGTSWRSQRVDNQNDRFATAQDALIDDFQLLTEYLGLYES
jgi:hypothetical protein